MFSNALYTAVMPITKLKQIKENAKEESANYRRELGEVQEMGENNSDGNSESMET